jgi:hypothetical protein
LAAGGGDVQERTMTAHRSWVGIAGSAAALDLALLPGEAPWPEANTPAGQARVVERRRELAPDRIVLEASGG